MSKCIHAHRKKIWEEQVRRKGDRVIIEDISNSNGWYEHDRPEHRMYMRFLKQEAHRRRLGT